MLLSAVTQVADSNQAGRFFALTQYSVKVDDTIFFMADNGISGYELWKTDGTTEGTRMVRSLTGGANDTFAEEFAALNGRAWFYRPARGEIWSSDGTRDGTQAFAALDEFGIGFRDLRRLKATDNRLYFSFRDSATLKFMLASVDGTVESLRTHGQFDSDPLTVADTAGDRLSFVVNDFATGRQELWETLGDVSSTRLIRKLQTGVVVTQLLAAEDATWLTARTHRDGRSIHYILRHDQPTDTVALVRGNLQNIYRLTKFGSGIVFAAQTARRGWETWVSNGTRDGTRLVDNLIDDAVSHIPDDFVVAGDRYYFRQDNRVWTGTGQPGQTSELPLPAGTRPLTLRQAGPRVVIHAQSPQLGHELFVTDGTASGTGLLKEFAPGTASSVPSFQNLLGTVGDEFVFLASAGSSPVEFWKTDGTQAGTVKIKRPRQATAASGPELLTSFGDSVVFSATDRVHGREVHVTSTGRAGSRLLADINPGTADSDPQDFTVVGDQLFFTAVRQGFGRELWVTNGRTTRLVKDIAPGSRQSFPSRLTASGQLLFFTADSNDGNGVQLWQSDGTPPGTRVVLPPDVADLRSLSLSDIDGTLYAGVLSAAGGEIWTVNSATGLAEQVATGFDIAPSGFTQTAGGVVFRTRDSTSGWELWKLDDSPSGALLFLDANPGSGNGFPSPLISFAGASYFSAFNGADDLLMRTNGISVDVVENFGPGGTSSEYRVVGNQLFFLRAAPGLGRELWVTNGQPGNARLVSDLRPGNGSTNFREFAALQDRLYFVVRENRVDRLFESDGTEAGTRQVADGLVTTFLQPNVHGASPASLTVHQSAVWLAMTTPQFGRELFRIDPPTATFAVAVSDSSPRAAAQLRSATRMATPASLPQIDDLFATDDDWLLFRTH